MELILKSNNEKSLAKIIALAKKLNVNVEEKNTNTAASSRQQIKERILNFNATEPSSFGDAQSWEREQREDRNLPFA